MSEDKIIDIEIKEVGGEIKKTKKKRNKLWVIILDIILGLGVLVGFGFFFYTHGSFWLEYFTYVPTPPSDGVTIELDTRAILLIAILIASIIFAIILAIQFVFYSILSIVTGILRRWHWPFFTITHATLTFLNLCSFLAAIIIANVG